MMMPVMARREAEPDWGRLRERMEREREAVVPQKLPPHRAGGREWEPWQEERLWWMRAHGADMTECAREVGHKEEACAARLRGLARVRGVDELETWRRRHAVS